MKKLRLLMTVALSFAIAMYANAQVVTLYGLTFNGDGGYGVGFSYLPSTRVFTNLYGVYTCGVQNPRGSFFQASDSNLYCTGIDGVEFYNLSSNACTSLFTFTGTSGLYPGTGPGTDLTEATDKCIYGLTAQGGANGFGTMYKYKIITQTFTNCFAFTGTRGTHRGNDAIGGVIQVYDGKLYGMTSRGGDSAYGNLFKYNITTDNFTNVFNFTGTSGTHPGSKPSGTLFQAATDSSIYGVTESGGANNLGTLFKHHIHSATFTSLVSFTGTSGAYPGAAPVGGVIQASDGKIYGTTSAGGAKDFGVLFSFDPVTNTYVDLVDFTGSSGRYFGQHPTGKLLQASDGYIYGMTPGSRTSDTTGNIFRYDITTHTYTNLYEFTSLSGGQPYGGFIEIDQNITASPQLSVISCQWSVYPNPSKGIFTIANVGAKNFSLTTIEVFNVLGEKVYKETLRGTQGDKVINLSEQPNGVYFYRVVSESGNETESGKVIIQR